MIHSLAGGVLSDNGSYLFAKVEILSAPYWYIAPFSVEAGDRVLAPFGREGKLVEGTVLRTEICTQQTAPMPMNRVKHLEKKL